MLKVDVFVLGNEDFSIAEMSRRQAVPLRGSAVWFSSPEDIVLEKLDWFRFPRDRERAGYSMPCFFSAAGSRVIMSGAILAPTSPDSVGSVAASFLPVGVL